MSDPQRSLVSLLKVVVALLAVQLLLTVAVIAGAGIALKRISDLTSAPLETMQADLDTTRQLARELTARQDATARGLDQVARTTVADVKKLKERRAALSGIARGPVDKIDQIIGLMQLLSDELLVMLDHIASSQGVVAKHSRPSDTQRELVAPDAPDGGTPEKAP